MNDGLAQTGILPPVRIHALEINVLAIAVSITKQLTATTLNEMWLVSNGVDLLEELTIPGEYEIICAHDVHFLTLANHYHSPLNPRSLCYARNRRFWFNLEFDDRARRDD